MGETGKNYEKIWDVAEDRRKFEITLLWQRSLFFWGFIVVAFTGYGHFLGEEQYELALLVASFGFLSSVIWAMVNRGSKYWQEYWERQIDRVKTKAKEYHFFESKKEFDEKRERKDKKDNSWKPWKGMRFSPSRLTTALSDYVVIAWFFILTAQVVSMWNLLAFGVFAFTLIYAYGVYNRTKKHYDTYYPDTKSKKKE